MELRSRSRSMTPYQVENFIQQESNQSNNHHATRSSKRISSITTTKTHQEQHEEIVMSNAKSPITRIKSVKGSKNFGSLKTSDYSSDDGEAEVNSHLTENEKNKLIQDAMVASNGNTEISALNLYRRAGRYWDKYPKTDYTYSRHSRDRVEIAPGVVQMPNMSRRTIHSGSETGSYYEDTTSKSSYLRKRLFSTNNNHHDESFKIHRASSSSSHRHIVISKITSMFMFVYQLIIWSVSSVFRVSSGTTYLMKKLHHLSSRIMLLDTWIMKKSQSRKKTKAVVALCLLPLLLFGAWFLLSSLGSAVYSSLFPASSTSITADQVYNTEKSDSEFSNNNFNSDDILQYPEIHNIISKYHNSIDDLRNELNLLKVEDKRKTESLNRIISEVRAENIRKIAQLSQKLNRCCNKPDINLDVYFTESLRSLLNNPEFLSSQRGFSEWLHTLFIAKNELESEISNLTLTLTREYDNSIENTAKIVMERVITRLGDHPNDPGNITQDQIRKAIKAALEIYDADKTGLVDYAMEPMGGQIVNTRCTESYHAGTAVISVLGIPLWYPTTSPRIVILPGINPGECWAFQNFPGFIVIKLASKIKVSGFSMEHVSRLLVPDGRIDSAPKDFEVYGLNDENERDPVKLGQYVYEYDGDSIQFFAARIQEVVSMIEVRIKSNHGNPNYTCLYRFRVHGSLSNNVT